MLGHDRGPQAVHVERPIVAYTVHVECRSALNAAAFPAYPVAVDPSCNFRRSPVAVEALRLESQVDRVLMEIGILERLLMLEEMLVHRPEVPLCAGRFGCPGCGASMRVDLIQWEMPEDKTQ